MRFKHRYLLFTAHFEDGIVKPGLNGKHIMAEITDCIAHNWGPHGAGLAAAKTNVRYFSSMTSTGILRCDREHLKMVWAAVTLVTHIQGRPVILRVTHVSGTIIKVQQAAVQAGKEILADIARSGRVSAADIERLMEKTKKDILSVEA